jgi:ataxia telangiectasia mutated family protein
MSAFNRIKSVAAQLKSEKPKERQEGIQSLRDIFKHEQVIHKLDDAGDGRAWLFTFQALFETVLHEKRACLKKGLDKATPVAVRKLREAAQTLRWLTERSVTRLSRKVVKALFSHILQMVVYKESLFEPVAFDYIKALRAVLTYQPHLDHLEPETWTNIVFFCFNVLLGDVVDSKYNLEEDGSGESHEEVEDSDEDGEEGRPSGSKKRARRASPPGAHASTSASVSVSGLSRHAPAVSLEQIECAAIVSVLLNSASAPYLADPGDPAKLPRQIFKRLNRFFETYPTDTSAHQDMISALNAALQHLELNTMSLVTSFGIRIWSHLLSLWGTKTKAMKEGIVIALRTLFPLLAHSDQQPEFVEGITRFAKLMDAEVELRGGLEALSLDSLRLEIGQDESKRGAFETKTFRVGNQFEGSHALAWAALELQADCLAKVGAIVFSNCYKILRSFQCSCL